MRSWVRLIKSKGVIMAQN